MKKETVSFIVPTLNEEENIKDTIDTIERNVPYDKLDYEIIVVDGGSRDRTVEIVSSLLSDNEKLRLYNGGDIRGFGHAYKKGTYLAKGDYIILVPGDNEITGKAIRTILGEAYQADIIIPYFVNQELRSEFRQLISKAFVFILNRLSGLKLRYYNGAVLHRSEVLKGYNIRTYGFAYQAEILINLINAGFTYKEVATEIQRRSSGKTKIFRLRNIVSVILFLVKLAGQRIMHLVGREKYPESATALLEKYSSISPGKQLPEIEVPEEINYIAVFLTFACNIRCSYCINNYEKHILRKGIMDGKSWVRCLNRFKLRHNLPITLQGGEPTLHRDFYYIIDNLRPDIEIDILTNLQFDIDEFIRRVDPKRINRDPHFQSIRASYHPEGMEIDDTIVRVLRLQEAGFNICLSAVMHPENISIIAEAEKKANNAGILFFKKEFLGFHQGKSYGTYKYPEAVTCRAKRNVRCRNTELLIGPLGGSYKCTRSVYVDSEPIGYLLDPDFKVEYTYRFCPNYGYCNPCDVKVKTNRFLKQNHTSVNIRFIEHIHKIISTETIKPSQKTRLIDIKSIEHTNTNAHSNLEPIERSRESSPS
jgi:glycosyltransferase involved in cell wall biosynthesis/MoaA/NifB/PqqE/SkfB family radical SAM enzyme